MIYIYIYIYIYYTVYILCADRIRPRGGAAGVRGRRGAYTSIVKDTCLINSTAAGSADEILDLFNVQCMLCMYQFN